MLVKVSLDVELDRRMLQKCEKDKDIAMDVGMPLVLMNVDEDEMQEQSFGRRAMKCEIDDDASSSLKHDSRL